MADWVLLVLTFLVVAGSTSRFTNRTAGSQRPGSRREPRSSPGQLVVYRKGTREGFYFGMYIYIYIYLYTHGQKIIHIYIYICIYIYTHWKSVFGTIVFFWDEGTSWLYNKYIYIYKYKYVLFFSKPRRIHPKSPKSLAQRPRTPESVAEGTKAFGRVLEIKRNMLVAPLFTVGFGRGLLN